MKKASNFYTTISLLSIIALSISLNVRADEPQVRKKPASQNPSPMAEHIRTHERLKESEPPGEVIEIPDILPKTVEVFMPIGFSLSKDTSLLIHFHGAGSVDRHAARQAGRQIVAVSVNLGFGSSAYGRPFADSAAFPQLLTAVKNAVREAGHSDIEFSNIYLTSFSAGYGAIRAILTQQMKMIDGVILLDSMHTGYIPSGVTLHEGGKIEGEGLSVFLEYAKLSIAGKTRFITTHSCIFPGTYASTTESAQYIIDELGLTRTAVLEWGPMGMQMLSRTEKGHFTVLAFAGNTAPDHVDQLHSLPVFLKMLLDM